VFYFLTSKTLKAWKNATERIKREKIRKAYGQIRRRNKMNHAWGLLSVWRRQANTITWIRSLAVEVCHDKKMMSVLEIFDRWRGRTEEMVGLELMCEQSLLKKRFHDMRRAFSTRQRLEIEAIRYFEDCSISLSVKKWSRVALQLRARQHLAFELREKHGRKVLRKIISHWNQRAPEKRQSTHKERNPYAGLDKNTVGIAERMEIWSELGDNPDLNAWADGIGEANSSIPFPGYLSTPSKRSSRARMIARFPSTTPTAPLSTPFERHLRAQYLNRSEPPSRRA
jgi:protein SFI1